MISGRTWETKDFFIKNNTLNVILGNTYKKVYKIHDVFEIYYLGKLFSCKVIGFLEPDIQIGFANNSLSLDNYVLIPGFHITSKEYEKSNQKEFCTGHYLSKTVGYIWVDNKKEVFSIMDQFKKEGEEYGLLYNCTPLGASYADEATILSDATVNRDMFLLFIVLVSIVCIASSSIFIFSFCRYIKTYSIHLMNGASLFLIKKKIYGEILSMVLGSFFVSMFCFYYFNRDKFGKIVMLISFGIVLLIQLLSFIITFFVTNSFINKTPIYLALRRRE